jgi:hypothetical protein
MSLMSAVGECGQAAEARSHGRGGIAVVVTTTGISAATVRPGIAEVLSGEWAALRRPGAGRF